uniref:28S ribosomal protein S18c, mitochondrial n=1 Tax=Clastoptera arizonana TaxID=38151 RepID=A0A1B6CDP2_9HEMI
MELLYKFVRLHSKPITTFFSRQSRTQFSSSTLEITASVEDQDSLNGDEPLEMLNPFQREKGKCILCKLNIKPDWKNVRLLSQFQSSYTGRIYGRHITGLCSKKQTEVEKEIIKAQTAGLFCKQFEKNLIIVYS